SSWAAAAIVPPTRCPRPSRRTTPSPAISAAAPTTTSRFEIPPAKGGSRAAVAGGCRGWVSRKAPRERRVRRILHGYVATRSDRGNAADAPPPADDHGGDWLRRR